MAVLKKGNVEWVPVSKNFLHFVNDDNGKRFQYIPGTIDNKWPELMGFDVRNLPQLTLSDYDD